MLKVPYHKQQTEISCLPACIKMVLNYYGDDVEELDLLEKGKIGNHPGTWDAKLAPHIIKKGYYFESWWKDVKDPKLPKKILEEYRKSMAKAKKLGFKYQGEGSIEKIKKLIDKGIPVIVEVEAAKFYGKKSYEFTHVVVVNGYDGKGFFYLDPWKTKKGKMTFAKLLRCWKFKSGLDNSMTAIYPKK